MEIKGIGVTLVIATASTIPVHLDAQRSGDASVAATLRRCEQLLPQAVKIGNLLLSLKADQRGFYPVPTRQELSPSGKTKALEKPPTDAWGNPFEMELADDGVRVWSWGPDGKKRTKDDLKCQPKKAEGDLLYQAASTGNVVEVRRLIAAGAKPNTPSTTSNGAVPLHAVAFANANRVEIARLLVEAGADINFLSTSTTPPTGVQSDTVKLGAVTALHNAAILDRRDLAEFLIKQGADVNLGEISPLFNTLVAGRSDTQILELLLKAGAYANLRTKDGFTPTIKAAQLGLDQALQVLLAHGADPHLRTTLGNTALTLAVDNRRVAAVSKLIAAGADVNSRNNRGQTALMTAAWHGDATLTAILLDAKADPNIKDNNGLNAVQVAKSQGHQRVADIIAQRRQ